MQISEEHTVADPVSTPASYDAKAVPAAVKASESNAAPAFWAIGAPAAKNPPTNTPGKPVL
jgi:hypothetical protein